jgi:hypothetical protein
MAFIEKGRAASIGWFVLGKTTKLLVTRSGKVRGRFSSI